MTVTVTSPTAAQLSEGGMAPLRSCPGSVLPPWVSTRLDAHLEGKEGGESGTSA